MATIDPPTEPARYEIFRRLAADLQVHRGGVHGAKMAENLLRFADGRELLGVAADAERAIYFEAASQSVIAVRFDKHGVYEGRRELLTRGLVEPSAWVEAHGDDCLWVHPRYTTDAEPR
jgi:hypothetical protein